MHMLTGAGEDHKLMTFHKQWLREHVPRNVKRKSLSEKLHVEFIEVVKSELDKS